MIRKCSGSLENFFPRFHYKIVCSSHLCLHMYCPCVWYGYAASDLSNKTYVESSLITLFIPTGMCMVFNQIACISNTGSFLIYDLMEKPFNPLKWWKFIAKLYQSSRYNWWYLYCIHLHISIILPLKHYKFLHACSIIYEPPDIIKILQSM